MMPAGGSHGSSIARSMPLVLILALATLFELSACGQGDWVPVPDSDGAVKSSGEVRAARRLYDGAPPVIPHNPFGADCSTCHDTYGASVEGVGFALASPHDDTDKADVTVRCRQCHVFVTTDGLFAKSEFVGLRQDLRPGGRLYVGAPPTIPHKILMRENCTACHAGPGARSEIITTHPERIRCRQCHVPVATRGGVLTYGQPDPGDPEGS